MTGLAIGQSADQNLPTPILSNEISGKIAPLDLGDPRVTRHFYAFEGTPGDVLITIESKNLNGDMDIFTAVTFRPLMKTTLYAIAQSPEVTKGIYLRARQILILRVEARTPNDDDGTYRVRFGGSFALPKRRSRRWYSATASARSWLSKSGHMRGVNSSSA